jgi:translation initiation factor IF-1
MELCFAIYSITVRKKTDLSEKKIRFFKIFFSFFLFSCFECTTDSFVSFSSFCFSLRITNMVKNKTGGKRSKGLARKDHDTEPQNYKVRTKEDAAKETKDYPGNFYYYARVVKSYGNCRFAVSCDDGHQRTASCMHFGGKKNRRENNIELGSCLLVGVTDYHTAASGKDQPCEILELYKAHETLYITFFQEKKEDDFENETAAETSIDFDSI